MLKDILNFRREVRYYAPTPISEEKVRECLKLATLAPTSSNMQLYELYHITDKAFVREISTRLPRPAYSKHGTTDGGFRDSTGQTPPARQDDFGI